MAKSRLPLMPLNAVLFPGMPMPLSVWEPRYLELAQHCIEHDSEFGVALIREGAEVGGPVAETHSIGTTAAIAHVLDAGDHMMVLAVGQRRFQILRTIDDGPYPEAEVKLLAAEGSAGVSPELMDDVRSMFADEIELILQLLGFEGMELEIPAEAEKLSYMIAAHLRVPLQAKQELLETERSSQRLARELEVVQKELQEYRLLLAAREQFAGESGADDAGGVFSVN